MSYILNFLVILTLSAISGEIFSVITAISSCELLSFLAEHKNEELESKEELGFGYGGVVDRVKYKNGTSIILKRYHKYDDAILDFNLIHFLK
jgi:hypothetical protein